jgi:pyridinium-3,5-bisthiocarboxylic acid mononucleotide nickel chelatase
MGETIYFDCFSGAAGDMLVGALLDLGAPLAGLREDLSLLRVPGFEVDAERKWRGGLAGTHFVVRLDPAHVPPRRNLPQILALIERSGLPAPVVERAARVFQRIGAAEAKVHGCPIDEVHFHEVGAIDSIADVVGFCALHHRLGAPRLLASPIAVGEGFVKTEHGRLPVPAMATLELLTGVPIENPGVREELCTPTGAALLSTLCEGFGRQFAFVPRRVGYGLGTRDRTDPPNAVRAVLCELAPERGDEVVVLETNLDDATGQEVGRLIERCLAAGALDALAIPVVMKKGRPGHVVQVLARPAEADAVEALLLADSPTLGVRRRDARRRLLPRRSETIATSLGEVRVKVAWLPDGSERLAPEFDDLARLADAHKMALERVRQRVQEEIAAARRGR